jgi:hypothetical protein
MKRVLKNRVQAAEGVVDSAAVVAVGAEAVESAIAGN